MKPVDDNAIGFSGTTRNSRQSQMMTKSEKQAAADFDAIDDNDKSSQRIDDLTDSKRTVFHNKDDREESSESGDFNEKKSKKSKSSASYKHGATQDMSIAGQSDLEVTSKKPKRVKVSSSLLIKVLFIEIKNKDKELKE
jgi:hypothetical protein